MRKGEGRKYFPSEEGPCGKEGVCCIVQYLGEKTHHGGWSKSNWDHNQDLPVPVWRRVKGWGLCWEPWQLRGGCFVQPVPDAGPITAAGR